jgi:hypothetical protein
MDDLESEWRRKGTTLSHKTAQEEFALTWEEIVRAIRAGKLHCQQQSMHIGPFASSSNTVARGCHCGYRIGRVSYL